MKSRPGTDFSKIAQEARFAAAEGKGSYYAFARLLGPSWPFPALYKGWISAFFWRFLGKAGTAGVLVFLDIPIPNDTGFSNLGSKLSESSYKSEVYHG